MITLTFIDPFIESGILKEREKKTPKCSPGNNSRIEVAKLFRSSFTSLEREDKSSFWKGTWVKFEMNILTILQSVHSTFPFKA